MRIGLLICISLCCLTLQAQKKVKLDPVPFAERITPDDLKQHLYIIAGPEMEGRETAMPGQKKAATYIEEQFQKIGLAPGNNGSYQMKYPVFQDANVVATIAINGVSYKYEKDFYINPRSSSTATLFGSEVIYAGNGIEDATRNDYNGLDVKGKIVLIKGSNKASWKEMLVMQETAAKKGAAALLIVQNNIPRRNMSNNILYTDAFKSVQMPNIYLISDKMAAAIAGTSWNSLQNSSPSNTDTSPILSTQITLQIDKNTKILESSNVLGFLEGGDLKDEYIILTAHYDHLGKRADGTIFYGADDDGSGTVSILELAEAFVKAKEAGKGPRRSIIFMTVSGEEKGLWGSEWYGDHPVFPLEKTSVNLNIDMVGRIDPKRTIGDSTRYIYIVGDDKISSELKPISEAINKKYTKLELDYKYNDPNDPERIYYRSDHYNFARKGVPIIFYFNGTHNDYHQSTDTPDKIVYDQMAKRVQLVFYTAWEMANRDQMLKRDKPLQEK